MPSDLVSARVQTPSPALKKMKEEMKTLIQELKKKSISENTKIWKRVAIDLEKPNRRLRTVNLSRINENTKKDETVIIPGKVLAGGDLQHPITISAWKFSKQAEEKIKLANGKIISLYDIIKTGSKNKKIRILG